MSTLTIHRSLPTYVSSKRLQRGERTTITWAPAFCVGADASGGRAG